MLSGGFREPFVLPPLTENLLHLPVDIERLTSRSEPERRTQTIVLNWKHTVQKTLVDVSRSYHCA